MSILRAPVQYLWETTRYHLPCPPCSHRASYPCQLSLPLTKMPTSSFQMWLAPYKNILNWHLSSPPASGNLRKWTQIIAITHVPHQLWALLRAGAVLSSADTTVNKAPRACGSVETRT